MTFIANSQNIVVSEKNNQLWNLMDNFCGIVLQNQFKINTFVMRTVK